MGAAGARAVHRGPDGHGDAHSRVDPPPPGTPGPLSRPTPEALGGLLEGGGFSDVEVEETEVSFEWESAAEFVAMVKDTVPPLVAMIEKNAPDNPDAAWNAILEAVEERASETARSGSRTWCCWR